MKCAVCDESFNDGVQCGTCKKYLDFGCANISEAGYRKLGPDRRAVWKCPQCKLLRSSPIPGSDSAMLDTILSELREVKSQLASLPALLDDVKSIKQELTDLKESCDFNSAKLNEQAARMSDIERKMIGVQKIETTFHLVTNEISTIKRDFALRDQYARLNNVEVKGIPVKANENLFVVAEALTNAIGCAFAKTQINYIARVPVHNSREKSIIITFINRYIKEEFVAAARAKKNITAADIGFVGNTQRIYVNDHLTPDYKNLLTKTKTAAKTKGYNYVWVKFCKIHARKNDTSHVLIISSESDLNKIA